MERKKVAWYDSPGSGWVRDIWVLTHFPYTVWHLSYVVIGAALAPVLHWPTLGWTLLAFFLAMGVTAHCLDELKGRPLKTELPAVVLLTIAAVSIVGAGAIGVLVGLPRSLWILPTIIFGGFIVAAYNLEWFKGRFHTDLWFAVAWGAFPVITAYLAQTGQISWSIVFVALGALFYSLAQRELSKQSRFWRRKVTQVSGIYLCERKAGSFDQDEIL
ncbi:hypothetical protein LCGC14_1463230, partial [marine sediment metagenome]